MEHLKNVYFMFFYAILVGENNIVEKFQLAHRGDEAGHISKLIRLIIIYK